MMLQSFVSHCYGKEQLRKAQNMTKTNQRRHMTMDMETAEQKRQKTAALLGRTPAPSLPTVASGRDGSMPSTVGSHGAPGTWKGQWVGTGGQRS